MGKSPYVVRAVAAARSAESVFAWADKIEEVQVAQDLELLTNLVADMPVLRMEFGETVVKSINVRKRELCFPQRVDDV